MLNWIKFFVFTTTFLICGFGFGQVMISQYIETNSGTTPKGIEIFNYSSSDIVFSGANNLQVFQGTNGAACLALAGTNTVTGTLLAGETWVIGTSNLTAFAIANGLNLSGTTDFGFNFNGDDAIQLYLGGVLMDVIGTCGSDPGSSWSGSGVSTANQNIAILNGICDGTIANWTDPSLRFETISTGTDMSGFGTAPNCAGTINTVTTDALSSITFSVDCSAADNGTADFSTSGIFNVGNTFIVELSDASGSFASPTTIGDLSGAGAEGLDPAGTINFTIPLGTISGTGYRIRINSSSPGVIGSDNGTDITINLTGGPCVFIPPHMTSVIINSCNMAPCGEGQNEIVFGNTGDYSILVNETNFNFSYTNTPPTLQNYTDNLTNNAATTLLINDECPSTDPFIDAYGTTIPPNSSWMLVNDQICPDIALDWTGLCNSGPIYVVYSSDPNWSLTGNFSNTTSDIRPYQTSITTTSGDTFTIDYETDGSLYPNNDGVFATFDSDGGPATSYGDDDCSFNASVLPIELNSFTGSYNGKSTDLTWETISEQNNDYFRLYHSPNGKVFEEIGTVPGSGTTSSLLNYSFEHRAPTPGINYYKLKSVDYDGTVHDKGIIAVQVEMNHIFYDQITQSIQMNYKSDYAVYGSDGRLITRVEHQNAIPFSGFGIFHVIDERTGEAFKLGVW